MKLSLFGQRYSGPSGTRQLMEDLGSALDGSRELLMLGGGNPSHIPEVEALFRERMRALVDDPRRFSHVIGDYDSPQGEREFLDAIAALLRREYGWALTRRNITLTNGSQSAFFLLFNMFAGPCAGGRRQRILLPMTPEYIGYADVGLSDGMFTSRRPAIEMLDGHLFKYHVDLGNLSIGDDIGAVCVSRPTNPTGNVISDPEIEALAALARRHDVPLIVDGAYGTPFPNIIFSDACPLWNDNVVLCLSLSKIGLPGLRTGIVVANEAVIDALTGMNAVLNLATGSMGAALVCGMIESGEILRVSREKVRPYYQQKAEQTLDWLRQAFDGCPFRVHKPEGAIFLWLWFPDLPISSAELYARLKDRGVIVLSGHHFFPGLEEEWQHRHECIRMTYAQDADVVRRGVAIIAEEVKRAYAGRAQLTV